MSTITKKRIIIAALITPGKTQTFAWNNAHLHFNTYYFHVRPYLFVTAPTDNLMRMNVDIIEYQNNVTTNKDRVVFQVKNHTSLNFNSSASYDLHMTQIY